jgi:hypothetical protein
MAKIIYKTTEGLWQDDKPSDEFIKYRARVPDDTMVKVLNHPVLYTADDWDELLYKQVVANLEVRRAVSYLQSTDYIILQWLEETTLGVDHYRTEDNYRNVLERRNEARQIIRAFDSEN